MGFKLFTPQGEALDFEFPSACVSPCAGGRAVITRYGLSLPYWLPWEVLFIYYLGAAL